MDVVNGESIRWTKSSRSLDTFPLRAFIIKSIRSFIICISATIWGGAVSMMDGRLVSCRSSLLGALLPSDPSWFSLLSIGTFLVFLLSVVSCVPLTQLLFQVMVLLSKVFHGHSKSLNLSLEGSRAWFVSLSVVSGCHRVSEYHANLCSGSSYMAYKSQSFPTDGAN